MVPLVLESFLSRQRGLSAQPGSCAYSRALLLLRFLLVHSRRSEAVSRHSKAVRFHRSAVPLVLRASCNSGAFSIAQTPWLLGRGGHLSSRAHPSRPLWAVRGLRRPLSPRAL
jgi:hypothetical protein